MTKQRKTAKTVEKQQRTVHGRPAGRHGRAPVAEATHEQHDQVHGRTCNCAFWHGRASGPASVIKGLFGQF